MKTYKKMKKMKKRRKAPRDGPGELIILAGRIVQAQAEGIFGGFFEHL